MLSAMTERNYSTKMPPKKKRIKRRAARRSKLNRKKKTRAEAVAAHNRGLVAILTLLYILHLIDEKTFESVTIALTPRKTRRKKRTTRRRKR